MKPGDPCPRCGGQLVVKHGPKGEFLGCTNYRSSGCKFTAKLPEPVVQEEEDALDTSNEAMLATVVEQLNAMYDRLGAVEAKLDCLLGKHTFTPIGRA